MKQPDILTNAKLLGKAGAAWGQAEMHRSDYTIILEEAFEVMGEDERLIQAIAGDEEREQWLMGIEADLDEKIMLKESPEKVVNKTEDHMAQPPKLEHSAFNTGFHRAVNTTFDPDHFLRLQTEANNMNEMKLAAQKSETESLRKQIETLSISGPGRPVKDPKAALSLPTVPAPNFDGTNLKYLPW